jgi:hypothetical protein
MTNVRVSGKTPPVISEMLPERVVAHISIIATVEIWSRDGELSFRQSRSCRIGSAGHIFINEGVTGHMLNQHYLSDMLPIHHKKAGAGHADGTSSEASHHGVPFLDRVVKLDTATVTQRDSKAIRHLAVMRQESAPDHDDHSHVACYTLE